MLLRYPGGKSRGKWSDHIVDTIYDRYEGGVFGELFFGGGGITFKLLKQGVLNSLLINELDVSLARLWNGVINSPRRLCDNVRAVTPSVEVFLLAKDRVKRGVGSGLEMLIVNRMSHGGRGVMAGPQGGAEQNGKYKIGCRWNAETLCKNVMECSRLFRSVNLIGGKCHSDNYVKYIDGVDLLYLDPPYWQVGEELYLHSFKKEDHKYLRLELSDAPWWVLSYNNVPEIREMYETYPQEVGSVGGNGGVKEGSELLITSW